MATVLDYLTAPEFADDRLTDSINIPPYRTGRPAQLGIFTDTPIATTYVRLGIEDEELTIIPARERGGESTLNMRDDRGGVRFDIPHFPLDDAITPADIQNLTGFNPDSAFLGLEGVYNNKLETLRQKHDLTHSYLDWGALNGVVLDGEGKQLLDLYAKFDLTESVVVMELDTSSTDVAAKSREAKGIIRKELRGAPSTGIIALAGKTFFDRYVSHPNVLEALRQYGGSTPNPARDDVQDTFTFAGLTLERVDEDYKVRTPTGALVTRKAIPDDEAILLPLGTRYFKRYVAPPDSVEAANRPPEQKVFVSTHELPHGKGREIHSESNVLPICTRPQLLTRLRIGN